MVSFGSHFQPTHIHLCTNIIYLVVMSLLLELKLLGGLGDRLTVSAFTLLQIRCQMWVLHLQTTGQGLDLGHLEEDNIYLLNKLDTLLIWCHVVVFFPSFKYNCRSVRDGRERYRQSLRDHGPWVKNVSYSVPMCFQMGLYIIPPVFVYNVSISIYQCECLLMYSFLNVTMEFSWRRNWIYTECLPEGSTPVRS